MQKTILITGSTEPITQDGLDVRIAVNTIAPYLLTQQLLPLIGTSGRVINLSSAAQSTVNLEALAGRVRLSDEFETASGQYFDNASGQFASPYPDALDPQKSEEIVHVIEVLSAVQSCRMSFF